MFACSQFSGHTQSIVLPSPCRLKRDAIWSAIQAEAMEIAQSEPWMAQRMRRVVLTQSSLAAGLTRVVAEKLFSSEREQSGFEQIVAEALTHDETICLALRRDLEAIRQHDPAATSYLQPFLFFKGLHALFVHRIAQNLWGRQRRAAAQFLQSQSSNAFGVDIHPAAKLGRGVFIDHATSVVIGETAVVGNDVVIMHEVTLGGTGKESGDRHPKIGNGVMLGAGAKLLGNIRIGDGAKIGAGSVVVKDVAPQATVVGLAAAERRRSPASRFEPRFAGDLRVGMDYQI